MATMERTNIINATKTEDDIPFALYEILSVFIVPSNINEYAGPYVFVVAPETIIIADDDIQRKQTAIIKKLAILMTFDINKKSIFFFITICLLVCKNIIS